MNPKFSVITCTKNSAKYLKDNIDSVRSQSFQDYEHVFIDGFSTDGTIEMILEYQKADPEKIKLFQFEPKGISNAMNHGVQQSTGEYLIHLHSDDRLYDNQVLADTFRFFQNHDCDWIYGIETRKNISGQTVAVTNQSRHTRYASKSFIGRNLLKFHSSIKHQAVFIKKKVYEKYGRFDEGLVYAMDYEFFLRIRNDTNWMFFDRKIDIFTVHGDNNSLAPDKMLENSIEVELIQHRYMNPLEYKYKYLFDLLLNTVYTYQFLKKIKSASNAILKNHVGLGQK